VYLPEIYLGATWTFTRKPKPSSVKNHKSAVDRKEKIHEQLLELAEDGLVEWWDAKSPLHDFV
jgi:predicted transcriptional regulator